MHLIVLTCAAAIVAGTLLSLMQALVVLLLAGILLALAVCSGCCRKRRLLFLPVLATGLLYGSFWLQHNLSHRLPVAQDRSRLNLDVVVETVEERGQGVRLIVRVFRNPAVPGELSASQSGWQANSQSPLQSDSAAEQMPQLRRQQLSWYHPAIAVRSGMQLNAELVLRSPRAFANDLPFDYEAFLLSSGIDASGYIRSARLIDGGESSLRDTLLAAQRQRHSPEAWPWLAGLVFGEQQAFSAEQWRLAQHTGTLHLLVVSGLHVGMVAALGWLLALGGIRFWGLFSGRGLRHPALLRLLLIGGLTAGYVWLAGMGIALQRAWIMIMVLLWLFFSGWRFNWLTALSLALLLVLLVNPLIWTRAGFGFSFVAVLALLAFFTGRRQGWLQTLFLPQWVVFISMLPLLWFWLLPVSLVQVGANLLAIPLLSLVILPLALLDAGLSWLAGAVLSDTQAQMVIAVPDTLLAAVGEFFWSVLSALQQQPWMVQFYQPWPLLLLWPCLLLLLRLGISAALSFGAMLMLLLALFWPLSVSGPYREQAVMLDVGQGQSLAFISEQHALVYDTGARFSEHFDAGSALLLPLLKQAGVRQINALFVSHSDLDHAGGLSSVLQGGLPLQQLFLGQWLPDLPVQPQAHLCRELITAGWQEVGADLHYRLLLLPDEQQALVNPSDNNQSCVVQVRWHERRFLLAGDIERDLEQQLVEHFGAELRSDVLVLAHHGSRSSSSSVFLDAVQPAQVWISAGFNNRFGHPHADVTARLEALKIPWYLTARDGAVLMAPDGQVTTARSGWQPPWRQP
ncbi:DNA internalization-related competence protein ComEC/Rec2 [Thalassolituus hydrocarboniclasticus]|uniref:DNA internalization-related competence protein ComEC/Rec2 n=1 Tax=Thalassolituus hydrocarboniclasticus TaxID=2742796 RepID=A0ABY6AB01_9GAMM|nr:DNA internalization-related competence protein ComEC/Rec2 [Thalassolituus hydrocarboniclasticus]UXD87614.1 DNA internalization-related competence protein ComEC/Rec2 [Thalassolituus hydrocarboniclasticus]